MAATAEFKKSIGECVMFCDGCGLPVQAGQGFCSKCGKQIVGPVAFMQPLPGRVQRHAYLLGILWLAISALNAIGGVILLLLGITFFPHLREFGNLPQGMPVNFFSSLFVVLGILVLAKAALGFIGGWGLTQRESWARVVTLVLAFISLFHVPLGTALGVYTLWVLLPSESQREYERMAAKAA